MAAPDLVTVGQEARAVDVHLLVSAGAVQLRVTCNTPRLPQLSVGADSPCAPTIDVAAAVFVKLAEALVVWTAPMLSTSVMTRRRRFDGPKARGRARASSFMSE